VHGRKKGTAAGREESRRDRDADSYYQLGGAEGRRNRGVANRSATSNRIKKRRCEGGGAVGASVLRETKPGVSLKKKRVPGFKEGRRPHHRERGKPSVLCGKPESSRSWLPLSGKVLNP